MRILQVVKTPQRRGAEIFALDLSRELERSGHTTAVVYLYASEAGATLSRRPGDRCLEGRERHFAERLPGIHPGLSRRLLREIRCFEPDIVQLNGSRTVKYGAAVRRLVHRPAWALLYRSIGDPRHWTGGWLRRALWRRLVLSQMDGIVATSRATLAAHQGYFASSVLLTCIPRGIDPDSLAPAKAAEATRADVGTQDGRPVLLFAGRLAPEKRLDRLLRVARAVAERVPGTELWVVGGGPLKSEFEEVAARSGPLQVRMLGEREDVAGYMAAADLLLLTSDTEGTPGALLEGAFLGLPAVATRVGGVAECAIEGETAFLAAPDDEHALVAAAVALLSDAGRRRRMGEQARRFATERFSIAVIAARYLEVYEKLAGDAPALRSA